MTQASYDTRDAVGRVNALYSLGLFKCAKITAEMLLAQLEARRGTDPLLTGPAGAQQKMLEARVLTIFAKALAQTGEPLRAKLYFDRALMTIQYAEVLQSRSGAGGPEAGESTDAWSGGPANFEGNLDGAAAQSKAPLEHADVSVSAAVAALKAGMRGAARTTLEAVPEKSRSVQALFLLGQICEDGSHSEAKYYYRAVLAQVPDAVYVAKCLIRISSPSDHSSIISNCASANDWLPLYLNAYACRVSHRYRAAAALYEELQHQMKSCADLLSEIGGTLYEWGKTEEALRAFGRLRRLDPYVVDQMDRYAKLLQDQKQKRLLNYLMEDLMKITDSRPEVWVTIARFCQYKSNHRSQILLEKAIKCDPKHVEAYILKAANLAGTKEALSTWRAAYKLSREYAVYQGLVEEHLSHSQYAEAMAAAKEALTILQKDARAYVLIGRVLVQGANHMKGANVLEKARHSYETALKADPECAAATMALVDLDLKEGKTTDAINRLKSHLATTKSDDGVLCRIAELYFQLGEFRDAIEMFSKALIWNPHSQRANDGMVRVEKKMNGIEDDDEADEGEEDEEAALDQGEEEAVDEEMEDAEAEDGPYYM